MTLRDLSYFAEVNHTKTNCYQELVHNVTTDNGLTFDLVEVAGQLMQLSWPNNKRTQFTFWPVN